VIIVSTQLVSSAYAFCLSREGRIKQKFREFAHLLENSCCSKGGLEEKVSLVIYKWECAKFDIKLLCCNIIN
jgi:hypothetical protein